MTAQQQEQDVLTALRQPHVRRPERFGDLTWLTFTQRATAHGLAAAKLPPVIVDSVMACQTGNACYVGGILGWPS